MVEVVTDGERRGASVAIVSLGFVYSFANSLSGESVIDTIVCVWLGLALIGHVMGRLAV